MDIHTFIGNYREAFGQQAELPIVFWYSDQPEAPAEKVNGCFFKSMSQVRNGKIISLNAETIGCGGGKFYTGFTDMPEHVPGFVSLKEKYKKTPDMVVDFIQELQVPKAEKAYLHFARIDKIGSFDKVEGILFLATPDMLAGLATWAFFDSNATDAVSAPFGSGCCSVVTQAILENRKQGKRTFLGFFDPSVRPHFEAELLSFTIPMSRFKEMYHTMRESCLFDTHAWSKLKERIQDRQKETKPFNHLNVSFEIRPDIVLREVTVEDAAAIYVYSILKEELMEQQAKLNEHNKQEYPPMHTTEHIINQTMIRLFGCGRSVSAHIERKKSKLDYRLNACPTEEQIESLEKAVNEVIARHLPVTTEFITQAEAKGRFDLERLPEDASETVRIVKVGDYDECLCIGTHVANTSEIGTFKIISHDWDEESKRWRMRFKLV